MQKSARSYRTDTVQVYRHWNDSTEAGIWGYHTSTSYGYGIAIICFYRYYTHIFKAIPSKPHTTPIMISTVHHWSVKGGEVRDNHRTVLVLSTTSTIITHTSAAQHYTVQYRERDPAYSSTSCQGHMLYSYYT